MRRVLIITTAFVALTYCKNLNKQDAAATGNEVSNAKNFTTIQWIDSVKEIGTLKFGDKTQITFKFKNTGTRPLLVLSAEPTCGCTVADYPKDPIQPGKEGEIVAGFDTNRGHPGEFKKSITVTTNTKPNGSTSIFFQGEIVGSDSTKTEK